MKGESGEASESRAKRKTSVAAGLLIGQAIGAAIAENNEIAGFELFEIL